MAKFKVGEEVNIKLGKVGKMCFHITQIEEITCSMGTQVFYEGRIWQDYKETGTLPSHRSCLTRLAKFNEIELEKKGD